MSILSSVYCLAYARWAWKRCLYTAGHESENWELASAEEFQPVPRLCRCILAVYEDDLRNPIWAPPGGYHMNPDWVILCKDYRETHGQSTPYMIYLDHKNVDVVLAIRGQHLGNQSDYAGQTTFDGGYVHNGLLNAARWVFHVEHEVLKDLLESNPTYTLTFVGHSLGAGLVALLTMVVLQNQDLLGNVERKMIRCYALAPTRCTSLNLAIRHADVINSFVLQNDFCLCLITHPNWTTTLSTPAHSTQSSGVPMAAKTYGHAFYVAGVYPFPTITNDIVASHSRKNMS
ncbi:hypothetical protein Ancab_037016 [Ancistrocladus abbreviatus]